jgi:hypothetical protein
MEQLIIQIPNSLSPDTLLPFSKELAEKPVADSYLFDFQLVGNTEPFGMLFLAALIRQFVRARRETQGRECPIRVTNYAGKSYASWMGLFKSFGLDHGNEPGAASGSGTYIPLTRLTVSRIIGDARSEYVHHGEIIEAESLRIARILTRNDVGPITETLTYAIREIMRNVVEHGETGHIWYAAQYWPTKSKVEISILDEGVGLLPSLRRNPRLQVDSNQKAIFLALQPGISGIAKENRKRSDGDWVNTGYGLYMTSSLCQLGGDFILCNDSQAVQVNSDGSTFHPCTYKGVAIRMVLDTAKIQDLNSVLDEIRRKGEAIAREFGREGVELSASKMSRMLSTRH